MAVRLDPWQNIINVQWSDTGGGGGGGQDPVPGNVAITLFFYYQITNTDLYDFAFGFSGTTIGTNGTTFIDNYSYYDFGLGQSRFVPPVFENTWPDNGTRSFSRAYSQVAAPLGVLDETGAQYEFVASFYITTTEIGGNGLIDYISGNIFPLVINFQGASGIKDPGDIFVRCAMEWRVSTGPSVDLGGGNVEYLRNHLDDEYAKIYTGPAERTYTGFEYATEYYPGTNAYLVDEFEGLTRFGMKRTFNVDVLTGDLFAMGYEA